MLLWRKKSREASIFQENNNVVYAQTVIITAESVCNSQLINNSICFSLNANTGKSNCCCESLPAVCVADRMSYFVAGLTNEDPNIIRPVYKQYHHVQYNGELPAAETASVSFPPTDDLFRYVIIQQHFVSMDSVSLTEVKVFLRGNQLHRERATILVILLSTITLTFRDRHLYILHLSKQQCILY